MSEAEAPAALSRRSMRPEATPAPAPASSSRRQPCIGLPVQLHTGQEVVPAILQRPSRTDPALWEVIYFLPGAATMRSRAAVKHSESPQPGCWSYLPV